MNRFQTFEQFLSTQSIQVDLYSFVIGLVLSAILAYLLSRLYVRFGTSLSNRTQFARNFIIITMTTMFIISIVKSSLALSLGLVGALSIVRFRAAIKEPEELAYLFLCIAIGLGFGAGQIWITLVAFVIIIALIIFRSWKFDSTKHPNLHVTVSGPTGGALTIEKIAETLADYSSSLNLRRYDEAKGTLEASFLVEFPDFEKMTAGRKALQSLGESVNVSFLDNRGVF